jgi:hypothetical protein
VKRGVVGSRAYAALVSVAMLAAVLWPMVRKTDGFPLSNYPMFSRARKAEAQVFHVVAFSSHGEHRPVSPSLLGTEEVMQASQAARIAFRRGAVASMELCREVASRVVADQRWKDIESLEVREDVFDTIAYWEGDRKPRRTRVRARCEVSR